MRFVRHLGAAFAMALISQVAVAADVPSNWSREWPDTDFAKAEVPFTQFLSGGPPKDGIPSIDAPKFRSVATVGDVAPHEPVISVEIDGTARAYPVQILMWHEIVNDRLAGRAISVTYCPLCNSAVVFDRNLDGRELEFGTTGKLRNSDLVMYDRQTESWWQQFTGRAVVGELTGETLKMLPSRMEPLSAFAERHPDGEVLERPQGARRPYGSNPYVGYDTGNWPFLYRGDYDGPIPPLSYVVSVDEDAWPLSLLREAGTIEHEGLVLRWRSGMASALSSPDIRDGTDIGSVEVTRNGGPVVFHMPFAFAFKAFEPDGTIHTAP
ncbi:MAG: DUF3179 domain-containing protein [Pseudomonadota bacterium]